MTDAVPLGCAPAADKWLAGFAGSICPVASRVALRFA